MCAAGYVIRVTTASGRPSPFRSPLSISVAPPTSSAVNGTTTFEPPNTTPAVDRCVSAELVPEGTASVAAAARAAIVVGVGIFIFCIAEECAGRLSGNCHATVGRTSGAGHRRRGDGEVVERNFCLLLLPVRGR